MTDPERKAATLVALGAERCWISGCDTIATKRIAYGDFKPHGGFWEARCDEHAHVPNDFDETMPITIRDL